MKRLSAILTMMIALALSTIANANTAQQTGCLQRAEVKAILKSDGVKNGWGEMITAYRIWGKPPVENPMLYVAFEKRPRVIGFLFWGDGCLRKSGNMPFDHASRFFDVADLKRLGRGPPK